MAVVVVVDVDAMKNCDGYCGGGQSADDDVSDGVWTKSVLSLNLSSQTNVVVADAVVVVVVVVSLCLWAIGKKEIFYFKFVHFLLEIIQLKISPQNFAKEVFSNF